jgi:anaerobic magnesium-protoporphyrin IX monomethyl ester cyclase
VALAYLAGYLRKHSGFSIEIIDAKLERLYFGQVLGRIKAFNPDLIGFTAFTNEIKPAAHQAALVKKYLPNVVTVIGGVHLTALPKIHCKSLLPLIWVWSVREKLLFMNYVRQ